MAQKSILSFFTKSTSAIRTDDSEVPTSSDQKKQDQKSPGDGKRKREESTESLSSSPVKKIDLKRSPDSLPPLRQTAPVVREGDTLSPGILNAIKSSKKQTEQATKVTKKRKSGTKSPRSVSKTEKENQPASKTESSQEESPAKVEARNEPAKSKSDAKKNVTKRRRIIQHDDSSDEDGHLPLDDPVESESTSLKSKDKTESSTSDLETSESKAVEEEKKKESDEEDDKDQEKRKDGVESSKATVAKKTKSSPKSKSPKKMHSFFAAKDKKSPKAKENGSKSDAKKGDSPAYDPSSSNYHPIDDACWKRGEKVPYIALAQTLELIENTSARLKMIEILSNFLRSVIVLSPDDLLPSIYLCLNQLAPAYEGIELGIAETSLMKAIAQCTGRSVAQIKADAQETGDLGIVAEESRSNQRMMFQPAPLTVPTVFSKLKEIAQMTGHASVTKKVDKIQSMFVACRSCEARYLVRSLAGKLRIGLAEQSVLQALARACTMTPPNQEYPPKILNASKKSSADSFKQKYDEQALVLKTTYCSCPNYDMIMPVILQDGIDGLPAKCQVTPGIPVEPMLAQPTKGVREVLTRLDGLKFTCEWKYDGERAQIHINESGEVKIYSRNQEDNTSKYPDIIARMEHTRGDNVKSCILDCEAVAWDCEKKQILPFQILSTRKRKDANESDIKVQVCVFMFDLLYLNGEALMKKPFIERRQLLKDNFKFVEGKWHFATSLDTTKMEDVQEFLDESVKGNCEGLMVKTLEQDATYEIAKRSRNWLKLKKDYLDGVGDTLDVVVIGGYLGKGKRTGTYGGFLLACYDKENEEYQSICKIGTGFSDKDLQEHTEFFKDKVIPQPKSYYRYDGNHEPDHWFETAQVWEIKCADLSLSPVHRAASGIVDPEKGISLRFPRFVRVREDKNCEDATSAQQVADMYKNQDQIKNQSGNDKFNEEDFY